MIEKIKNIIHLNRRETPLPSQAEELETERLNNIRMNADIEPPIIKKVQFDLPPNYVNKNSTAWRAMPRAIRESTARRKWENSKYYRRKKNSPLTDRDIRRMVLDGTIPSGVSDSGATSTAGRPQDPFIKSNIPSNKNFHMPTGGTARASRTAKLHHQLREPARTVDIVPSLTDNTLISTGKFADANYFTVYDDKEVNIYDGKTAKIYITEEAVLRGYRCTHSKLWRIPLRDTVTNQNTQTVLLNSPNGRQSLNSMYHVPSTETIIGKLGILLNERPDPKEAINNVYDMPSLEPAIRYLHAAAGFPTKSTWLKAIRNNNYMSWPLITVKNVNKFFPESEETQQGHMKGQRQGVRSTKVKITVEPGTVSKSDEEAEEKEFNEENDIMVAIYQTNNTMHSDQTGKFPTVSSRGNKYQMILTHMDSGSIWVEATKNKTEGEMKLARRRALLRMKACGIVPKHQVMDNECSDAYKQEISESGMTYQLVPPNNHRRNIAEKAIQTWKNHFISVLSGTDENFPLHLWCQVIPQAERQLAMLIQTNINPKISTYTHLYGPHNYNSQPFVPIGMEAMIYDHPNLRKTFAQHCSKGYVLGTSTEHYRCWNLWNLKTKSTRVSGTVFFKHKYISNPTLTPADAIIAAANRMTATLRTHKTAGMTEDDMQALDRLGQIFTNAATNNTQMSIKAVDAQASPRVAESKTPSSAATLLTEALTAEARPAPRVKTTIFTPIQEPAPPPRVLTEPAQLIVAYPRAVVTSEDISNTGTNIPTITQEEGPIPRRPAPRTSTPRTATNTSPFNEANQLDDHQSPARNTRSKTKQPRTLTQELMLSALEASAICKPKNLANRKFPIEMLSAVLDEDTGELLEYRHLMKNPKYREIWGHAYGNELGRLAQGLEGRVAGTDTFFFINKKDIPAARWQDVTYGRIVVSLRPEKDDPHRVRLTVGGDRINYPDDCGTPTADMLTVKLILNSVISTKDARFMTIDIKDFYLNTPLERYEYMRMKLADLPPDFVNKYNLHDKVTSDGYVYLEIRKGMYGLPQAGRKAQELLEKRLNAKGYRQSKICPGFWKHDWRPICFSLVVDDFGVKYVGKQHAEHLMQALQEEYTIKWEWEGKRYIGLTIDWDYEKKEVHISMPNYIKEALTRFHHTKPKRPQDQPHPHSPPNYGAKQQFTEAADDSELLDAKEKKFIQEVVGTLLYYSRAVDCTMLAALGSIATQQAKPTKNTMTKVKQLLDYAATHPHAAVTYRASEMVLAAHSDASYLSETKARSRAGGHFFMAGDTTYPENNGAVHTVAQIIKVVMSSAAEAELGALYINCREAIPARQLLQEMGHTQPPTPMQTDNSTALGVVLNLIQPKRTKAMDMRFHWLRCRARQKQFRTYWRAGPTNNGDYVTKHHAPAHHRNVRPVYLTPAHKLLKLRTRNSKIVSRAATRLTHAARVC